MVSDQAKASFDFLVEQAIRNNMLGDDKDACSIERVEDPAQIKNRQMVILTISSYAFRVMLFVHFTRDKATRAHFAAMKQQAEMDDAAFLDAVMESGNLACGALNRELGNFFPHLGMSTPGVLDHGSLEYVHALGAGHVRHWRVNATAGAVFHLSAGRVRRHAHRFPRGPDAGRRHLG
ncbi:MAG: hypothetical protein QM742_08960 [Aquabacterium sp.]